MPKNDSNIMSFFILNFQYKMQNYDALKRYMEKSDSSVYMGKHTDYKRRTHLTVLFVKT